MTINDPEMFCKSLWDWSCLDGCFGQTKIKPTDMDGYVERHGYFIGFETKLPNVPIPDGQNITFEKLVSSGYWTVLIAWGNPGNPIELELRTRWKTMHYQNTNLDKMRELVSKWFDWVDNQTAAPKFEAF